MLGHAPGSPSMASCSDIFARSDPPTNPMTTFFLSSFKRSSISLEAPYGHLRPALTSTSRKTERTHLPGRGESPIHIEQDKFLDRSVSERGHSDGDSENVVREPSGRCAGTNVCNLASYSAPSSLMQSGDSNKHPQRSFPPLYTSVGDTAADRLAFFHTLERLKVRYSLRHIERVT